MSARTTTAAILTKPETFELDEVELTDLDATSAILKVEASGICGTDIGQFRGTYPNLPIPMILGHEPIGIIEEIGDRAAKWWGVEPGDRVLLEAVIPCMHCEACWRGTTTVCKGWPGNKTYGFMGRNEPFSPTGSFSQHMWLHANTRLHRVSNAVSLDRVATFNALAAGVHWATIVPQLRIGETIVILGPGQRGLAAVIAAKAAGAGTIIITGLSQDKHKLELAKDFGADHTIDASVSNVPEVVADLTNGRMADITLDVTTGGKQPVLDAISCVRAYGRVILAGMKEGRPIDGIDVDDLILRAITVRGVCTCDSDAYEPTVRIIEDLSIPLERLHTHSFPLAEAATAIRTLAGDGSELAIGVSLRPHDKEPRHTVHAQGGKHN